MYLSRKFSISILKINKKNILGEISFKNQDFLNHSWTINRSGKATKKCNKNKPS